MIKISRFYSRGYTDILMFFLVLVALATPFLISIPVGSADHVTFPSQLSPLCRSTVQFVGGSMRITDPSLPGCNEHDKAFINGPSAPPVLPPITAPQKEAYPGANSPADCTASITNWSPFFNPTCWLRMLGALFTSVFVWIGIKILVFAGFLFNYLLDYTVIKFRDMYLLIQVGVETGWTAFRDIANIIIIGIFTFIALSIILGLKEYGQKKMIANVLTIAVLINFSLLFTKMIIDASNFTALQFYNAALSQVAEGGGTQNSTVNVAVAGNPAVQENVSSEGISGQFMKAIGITGFGDSYNQIRATQEANKDGLIGIGFGILSFIYFLGAAIVLFYGCFLLVSRAVLIIFLMITASLAFASHLIPAWGTSSYGWKTWWDSLLRVAAFAPLLMLLLWITLMISKQLAVATGTKTIGGMATAPKDNVAAVFGYLMILGLLFLSFRLSSVWAGKISGFSWAAMAPAMSLAFGARLAGAPLKYFGGSYATRKAEQWDKAARDEEDKIAKGTGSEARRRRFLLQSSLAKPFTKTDFNLANTALGKQVTGVAGLKGFWAGQTKGKGYEAFAQGQAKKAAEQASKLVYSPEEQKKLMGDEIRRQTAAAAPDRTLIQDERRMKKEQIRATHKDMAQREVEYRQRQADREQDLAQKQKEFDEFKKDLQYAQAQRENTEKSGDTKGINEAASQIVKLTRGKSIQEALREKDEDIKRAVQDITTLRENAYAIRQDRENFVTGAVRDMMKGTQRAHERLDEKIRDRASENLKGIVDRDGKEIAAQLANSRFTNTIAKAIGLGKSVEKDDIAKLASKTYGDRQRTKDLELLAESIQKSVKKDDASGPAPTSTT